MEAENHVDFSSSESCRNYLVSKFNDLLDSVNNLYGRELMEELLKRLEKTIAIFHQDVQTLVNELKAANTANEPSASPVSPTPQKVTSASASPEEEDEWSKHLS